MLKEHNEPEGLYLRGHQTLHLHRQELGEPFRLESPDMRRSVFDLHEAIGWQRTSRCHYCRYQVLPMQLQVPRRPGLAFPFRKHPQLLLRLAGFGHQS